MKWFKHDSDAGQDAKLRKLRLKYGMEGYGLYWYCLELVARNVDTHNLSFELEHDAEIISADTGIHRDRVEEIMKYMLFLALFEQNSGVITCLKMATRTDEYISKTIKNNNNLQHVPTNSRQAPDSVGRKSVLIEENRREKNKQISTPAGVDDSVFQDFLKIRKAKRAPLTQTALRGIEREAIKAGITLGEAIKICCERGWSGFNSSWVDQKKSVVQEYV